MAGTLNTIEQTLEHYRKTPTYINNYVLAAGVAQTVTAPVGSTHCLLSCTGNYFVNWKGDTAKYTADTAGDGSEVNPIGRNIGLSTAGDQKTFSVISPEDCVLAVAFGRI